MIALFARESQSFCGELIVIFLLIIVGLILKKPAPTGAGFGGVPGMARFLLVKVQSWVTYRPCSEAQAEIGDDGVKEACSKIMSLRTEI